MITYAKAKELKELGFNQRRHDHARYYINENTIAYFEDIKNAFRADDWGNTRQENLVDWLENFSYIPELVDLIGTESYNLTTDAAVFHFIENHKQPDLVERTIVSLNPPLESLPPQSPNAVISDSTLEGIEKIKQSINATQIKEGFKG